LLLEKGAKSINIKHKIELDIIHFLAENGPNSAFDISRGQIIPRGPRKRGRPLLKYKRKELPKRDKNRTLAYEYKRVLRHAKNLVQKGLLQSEKLERRDILSLTFDGFHAYLQDKSEEYEHLDRAIKSNSKLLPFAKYWSEIAQIVGENVVSQGLVKAVSHQIFRSPARIEKIKLEFDSFLVEPKPIFPQTEEKKLNKEFADFLSKNLEMRNSYVSYLATHDIFFLTSEKKWSEIDSCLDNLESEKALAFFEKRNIHNKPIFIPGTRLKEFFPRFATIEFFFTGMLMEKVLWKEK